ncbi:MAG: pyridoxal phosphate-dependent aminotransferase [Phycisphaerae bacterium]
MTNPPIARHVLSDMQSASWIRAMFEKGRALKSKLGAENVFDFSLGNPDGVPPDAFFKQIQNVASHRDPQAHRYMPNAGFDETRAAIAWFLCDEYRVDLDAAGVLVTCGAAGGMNVTLRTICNPADEVIVLAPYFPEYRFYIQQANAKMVLVETRDDLQPDLAAIERAITEKTRAIIINSPNNPTGAVYPETTCEAIGTLFAKYDSDDNPRYVLCDDPYKRLVYDVDWCPTVVRHYHRAIIVSSYSKDLSIAGERIGYLGVPNRTPGRDVLMGGLTMLNRTLGFVNAPAFMQRVIAGCADAICDIDVYRRKRDLLCDGLRDAGYSFSRPGGGMFVFPATPIPDDAAFVDLLLKQNILVVPGRGFGRAGFVRVSLATPEDTIVRSLPGFIAARREALGQA